MDPALRKLIALITAKRPKTVLDHILKHGSITTADLKTQYGYSHPPRAARDVREAGISLKTTRETGSDGRPMAVYTIDEDATLHGAKGGRRAFPKTLRNALVARDGERCNLCQGTFPARALQIDHRVPYEIAGDSRGLDPAVFMLVCGSCNRAKSWSCENCPNWTTRNPVVCETCLWASPEEYQHIATEERRRLDIVWEAAETDDYDRIAVRAKKLDQDMRVLIKGIIRAAIRPKG